jgi:hypothetical protein
MSPRLRLLILSLLLAGCDAPGALRPAGASLTFDAQSTYAAGEGPRVPTTIAGDGAPEALPERPDLAPAAPGAGAVAGGGAAIVGVVNDERGLPVADATLTFADGRQTTTNAAGRYTLSGAFPAGALIAAKPGYATSVVLGLTGGQAVHLRRADGQRDLTGQRTATITGSVLWPSADHAGGAVYYVDTLQSRATQAMVSGDSYSVDVTTRGAGEPIGVIVVLASTQDNQQAYIGVSRPFAPFGGGAPGQVPMHRASETLTYQAAGLPAGTDQVLSQLEILQAGAPPVEIFGAESASGSFPVPPAGALPGTMRVTVAAQDALGTWRSMLSMTPTAGAATGTFLAVPAPTVDAATRRVSWGALAGADGYRLEVRNQNRPDPLWEAWSPDAAPLTLPAEAWPGRDGEFLLEAVAADGVDSRSVASLGPRALRITPWLSAPMYRVASRRFLP